MQSNPHMLRSAKKRVAIVVGAGAVVNAWNPVLRALQPYFGFELTADGANSFLARLVYLLRWWSSCSSPIASSNLVKHKELLIELRQAICRELVSAEQSGEIHVRSEFEAIVNATLVNYSKSFVLITTNWDRVINNALEKYLNGLGEVRLIPLHIHGSIADSDTIYLPSEMTKEPYRSRAEEQILGATHAQTWTAIEQAHRIVIYGLSVSPLDAELSQVLAVGMSNPNLKEVIVITPDHEIVAHRLNLLLDNTREIKVIGHEPRKLGICHVHTIRRKGRA